ncbi:unnamed protein product [Mytilus coruscus]|uniref:Uncharacterized protein n=1 Tax=Mytilus coruscus TaxID=42192 RepID=A0A6J8D5L8_MYTCO|nr:unnamed protein product [Mytilus coruscus]
MLKKIYMDNIARRNVAPADQQMTGNTSQTSASSDNAPNTTSSDASAILNTDIIASSNEVPQVQRDLTSGSGSNLARSSAVTEPRMNFHSGMAGTTSSNMAAPSASNVNNEVMTGMLNSMQSMQGTMLGLQQTVIKLININDRPIPVDANNLSTAYAAMRSNDPGPSTSSGAGGSQTFPLNGGYRFYFGIWGTIRMHPTC